MRDKIMKFNGKLRLLTVCFFYGIALSIPAQAAITVGSFRALSGNGDLVQDGFSSLAEAAQWGWDNSTYMQANLDKYAYGGVVYFYHNATPAPPNEGGTNYWWGYYRILEASGPEHYYSLVYAPNVPIGAKKLGTQCSALTPHPIAIGTGIKSLHEVDFRSDTLTWSHQYQHSIYMAGSTLGKYWRHAYAHRLEALVNPGSKFVTVTRANGYGFAFLRNGDQWIKDGDVNYTLTELTVGATTTGWRLIDESEGSIETYDAAGKLILIQSREGKTQTLAYDANNRLISVTDSFGRSLAFGYDSQNRIHHVTQPDGGVLQYTYDAKNNLSTIVYPDGKSKTYHYESSSFRNALTGVTDENGIRTITYSYDSQGRAYDEVMAGGVEHYQLAFGNNQTTVTDPLGTARIYNFQTVLGVVKGTGSNQPGGAGCGAASSAVTYDANSNVVSRTDFNNHKTCYAYDARSLETRRVEGLPGNADCSIALSSPPAPTAAYPVRTISTAWHPIWRLPTQIAEPKKLISYTYNGSGASCAPTSATVPTAGGDQPIAVLCKKIERATTDQTGAQGLAPALSGSNRVISWAYNQYGQVLSADGLRNEVVDVTTYTYYPATDPDLGKRGNLASIGNALGHMTQITAYDLNGRALTIVDPNGVTTTLTYTPRGWLKTRTVTASDIAAQTTTYDYDDAGQLIKVTQPDASYLSYTYDLAHRLTDIADAVGNSIHYTLDNAGNRIKEETKDPAQNLARQITREYDALNRLKTITGALQ